MSSQANDLGGGRVTELAYRASLASLSYPPFNAWHTRIIKRDEGGVRHQELASPAWSINRSILRLDPIPCLGRSHTSEKDKVNQRPHCFPVRINPLPQLCQENMNCFLKTISIKSIDKQNGNAKLYRDIMSLVDFSILMGTNL